MEDARDPVGNGKVVSGVGAGDEMPGAAHPANPKRRSRKTIFRLIIDPLWRR
ncbi:MAG: hypothetical protein QXI60_03405 [Thermofilaceae archaeon]